MGFGLEKEYESGSTYSEDSNSLNLGAAFRLTSSEARMFSMFLGPMFQYTISSEREDEDGETSEETTERVGVGGKLQLGARRIRAFGNRKLKLRLVDEFLYYPNSNNSTAYLYNKLRFKGRFPITDTVSMSLDAGYRYMHYTGDREDRHRFEVTPQFHFNLSDDLMLYLGLKTMIDQRWDFSVSPVMGLHWMICEGVEVNIQAVIGEISEDGFGL